MRDSANNVTGQDIGGNVAACAAPSDYPNQIFIPMDTTSYGTATCLAKHYVHGVLGRADIRRHRRQTRPYPKPAPTR